MSICEKCGEEVNRRFSVGEKNLCRSCIQDLKDEIVKIPESITVKSRYHGGEVKTNGKHKALHLPRVAKKILVKKIREELMPPNDYIIDVSPHNAESAKSQGYIFKEV